MDTARVRFGIFDFDPDTRELRKEGTPVRLQAQPAQVLALLVAHAGVIVSRETLRQAVWGADTFVDFDRGLNFCIAQIRSALGDSAVSPRYVRTIPKQGYQFVAPVTQASAGPPPALPPTRRQWWPGVVALALVPGAVAAWTWNKWAAKPPTRVAVVRFDNETGNADLDRFTDGLTDSLVVELAASGPGRYEVIGNAAMLRQPRGNRDLLNIGTSLHVGYVVIGQVLSDSKGRRVIASLIALPEQTHVRVARIEFGNGEPPPPQQDTARRIAGTFSTPIAEGRRLRVPSPPAVSN